MKGLILPSLFLVIIGALNWLLIGLLQFNLVTWIAGRFPIIETIIYVLVGVAGIILILFYGKIAKELL
ncbi:MAG: DUF378 domain-containing protein [Minisyncoccales bacterium]|jgi:uncharacterized membrane protein YuzA (DUF378 family)